MVDETFLKKLEVMPDEERAAIREVLKRKPRRGLQAHFTREQALEVGGKPLYVVSVGKERLVLDSRPPAEWPAPKAKPGAEK